MILQAIAFYMFAAVLLLSGLVVINARNPVYSVLFLILAFFNAAGLFVLLGAEFLAMLLVIVYVGAVAVLFLFVVMMLDVDFAELKKGAQSYLLPGLGIGGLLVAELFIAVASQWNFATKAVRGAAMPSGVTNTAALGHILYTDYVFYFETAGMILLVAMIGAIVLTLRHKPGVRRQKAWDQISREKADSLALVDVKPGEGVQ
ncbi:NADH-quinone oxidoreductase subunit J [Rhizomicrobium palustre]|uniref:NADH-quinone oxidoreductase subunit J n=1 Tax=Rhizomicrobium palustre TaxID=189966 RepID=A0A846N393_9PROT|nr:NADH-quinone oxidoreductase subunit J [Rhizomicrobium palustre]NIK89550.1 NADH-quinone oxidoreductase subunit J [Rhizomicrobium palustre]